jgi:hypothetical protein
MPVNPLVDGRGRQLHHHNLRPLLGLPVGKLPKSTDVTKFLGDVAVWVMDQPRPGRRKHRVMAKCPVCSKVVSAGRMAQHTQVHRQK